MTEKTLATLETAKELAEPEPKSAEMGAVQARAIGKFAESSVLDLSEAQIKILRKPIPIEDILIRPDGMIYLDWGWYAEVLDEAFGPGHWSLTPAPWNPKLYREGNITYREFVMWVDGQFVANAVGHHEEQRRTANFGDAAEATYANALTRCAKRLGVARGLWRKKTIEEYKRLMTAKGKPQPQAHPEIIDVEPDLFDRLKCKLDGAGDIKALKEAWDAAMQWKSKLSAEDFASLEKRKNERKEEFK